jgi:hypothetical protein
MVYQMAYALRNDDGALIDVLHVADLPDGWVRVQPRDGGEPFDVDPAYIEL